MANQPIPAPPLADASPSVPSLRTLGTGANQAAAGNDARFALIDSSLRILNDFPALRALIGDVNGLTGVKAVFLSGRATAFDGGEGEFVWTTDTTATDNSATIIVPTVSGWTRTGCWKRVVDRSVNARWFGAKGDGATNDSAAIQAAIDWATANRFTAADISSVAAAATYPVVLPRGQYRLTTALQMKPYVHLIGDGTGLVPDAGVDALTGVGYQNSITGICFMGGRDGVAIATGHLDTTQVKITDCEFHNQTRHAITVDNDSPSMILAIQKCKFYNTVYNNGNPPPVGTYLMNLVTGDVITVRDCWITTSIPVYVGDVIAHFTDVLAAPQVPLTKWFVNHGTLRIDKFRYGGEVGSVTLVENHVAFRTDTPRSLVIENSDCYSANAYALDFHEVPNLVSIRDCHGIFANGLYFRSTCNNPNLSSANVQISVDGVAFSQVLYTAEDAETAARIGLLLKWPNRSASPVLPVSAKVLQKSSTNAGDGRVGSASSVTAGSTTDDRGGDLRTYVGTSGGSDGSVSEVWETLLDGLADGIYTAVFEVNVTGNSPINGNFQACEEVRWFTFGKGSHVVSVPFYLKSSVSEKVGWAFYRLSNTSAWNMGDIRIFQGDVVVATRENLLRGTAAPGSGTWQKMDKVVNTNPTAGGWGAFECVASGSPGTWKGTNAIEP